MSNGKLGGSAYFDGNDDRVVISKGVLPEQASIQQPFSISFWEFSPGSTNDGYFVGAGSDSAGFDDIFLRRLKYGGNWGYAGSIKNSTATFSTFGNFPRAVWHHHVVTLDATGWGTWYIDGGFAKAQPAVVTFTGLTGDLYLGNRKDLTRAFLGNIDDLALSTDTWTAAEAKAIFSLASSQSAGLYYDAGEASRLLDLHDAAAGNVTIGICDWSYATGLNTELGQVVKNGEYFYLKLSEGGTGVVGLVSIPEPGSLALLLLGIAALGLRRLHQSKH